VDSEGRIQAVLTDPEDVFGNPHYMGASELAARLKSINTFERRGNTVWMDDFEDNIDKWNIVTTGTGAGATLSVDTARTGGSCAKLTTGDASTNYCTLNRFLPLPVTTKLGLEVSFTINNNMDKFWFSIEVYDGTLQHIARVRYDPSTDVLAIMDTTSYTNVATSLQLHDHIQMFHTIKMVMDYSTKKYVRCILNETEHDISATGYYTTSDSSDPYMAIQLHTINSGAGNQSMYVDDVIVTQNEPA